MVILNPDGAPDVGVGGHVSFWPVGRAMIFHTEQSATCPHWNVATGCGGSKDRDKVKLED
jgi:hypothetical protein